MFVVTVSSGSDISDSILPDDGLNWSPLVPVN